MQQNNIGFHLLTIKSVHRFMGTNYFSILIAPFFVLGVDAIADYFSIPSGIIRCQNKEKLLLSSHRDRRNIDTCNWKSFSLRLFWKWDSNFHKHSKSGPIKLLFFVSLFLLFNSRWLSIEHDRDYRFVLCLFWLLVHLSWNWINKFD